MSLFKKKMLAVAVLGGLVPGATFAADSATFADAIKSGKTVLSLRARYENVELGQKSSTPVVPAKEDDLLSLRTRLSYTSGTYYGFGGVLEFDDVSHFSDLNTAYAAAPLVDDPEGTELNEVYVSYTAGKTTLKYGRQRIILDNQRFVGGVGFRQNEQTYDGLSFKNTSLSDTTVFAAYVTNVNRIFGEASVDPTKPARLGNHNSETFLFNANYAGFKGHSISAYSYMIDNTSYVVASSNTYGLRGAGKFGNFGYAAEFASQSDGGDNTKDYSADYANFEGSYTLKPVTLTLGYELLGADSSQGFFVTPLATLHIFQGWTDQFLGAGLGNVAGGIEDTYLTLGGSAGPVKLLLAYHELGADDAAVAKTSDYGSELGFSVSGNVGPVTLSLKYADFSSDAPALYNDATKYWLTAEAKF